MTLRQLRQVASEVGVTLYSRKTKDELVSAIGERRVDLSSLDQEHAPSRQLDETRVVFLPRDPQWAYVFWEISEADRQQAFTAGASQLCLRVADVTGISNGGSHPHTLQEVAVDSHATEWYLPVPLSDRDYRVELGYRTQSGGWLSLATSSVARMPALEPAAVVADAFVPFSLETPVMAAATSVVSGGVEHERIYQLATATALRSRRVGSEVLHEWDQDSERTRGLNDSGAGLWASGRSDSGSGIVRPRSFWLVADAELIVYGATEPTARLSIADQEIPLEADGTFRVHVLFRDGEQLYPIKAVAADGEQERSIRLEFERRTPAARVNRKEDAVLEWF